MNLFDLSGKVAVVTGGNDGLGFGIAQGMALAGAGIVVAGRRTERNVAAAQALAALGVNTTGVEVDVCKESSCRSLLETTLKRFGRIDILINNAGIAIRKQPESYTLGEWNKVINTNLTGAFLCSQAAYPHMKRNGGGKIVNIGSMLSIFGASYAGAYGATESARREVAGLHERVLARTPAGRWGKPQDLAGIAVFLTGAASDFITGAVIPVDGGYSAQG
jgi:2-deoxy-D-gluconate 3-dehydrogenase